MKTPAPLRLLVVTLFALLTLASPAAAASAPEITPLAGGQFRVTAKATVVFFRSTKKLRAQAVEAATQYCAQQGKQLKIVDEAEEKPLFPPDFVAVTLTCQAVDAAAPEPVPAPSRPAAATAPTLTDVLYSELTKLDELRRKGLLTDAEFETEKQKVLSRPR